MSCSFYVACDLGEETGRVMLGTLHGDGLTLSEIRRFQTSPVKEKDSLLWNVPHLYQEILAGLREVAAYQEPVESISCYGAAADCLLFAADGSLITPAYHHRDSRTEKGVNDAYAKVSEETLYEETGVQQTPLNTLFQLAGEKPRRLNRAAHILPLADGFNYLLSGVPRVEMSLAGMTQLFNPVTRTWSERLLGSLELKSELFPPLVSAGTDLGPLRPELAKETRLDDTRVVAACSHQMAAAIAGLPIENPADSAFLRLGAWTAIGTELTEPLIDNVTRDSSFTNQIGCEEAVWFYKHTVGLWVLDECKRFWKERDRELDDDVLRHLAISAPPFEALIDLSDERFLTPGNMPLKIQAFCKDTGQEVPRKPGPIIRCVLESLALTYRKALRELEHLAGREFARLYMLGNSKHPLLNHFTANALQIPVIIAPADSAAIGSVIVQALVSGDVESLEHGREIVRRSFKTETIVPHAATWDAASERLAELVPS